jgi:glycine/D-amino acid oxidase-like deaminating enzyme
VSWSTRATQAVRISRSWKRDMNGNDPWDSALAAPSPLPRSLWASISPPAPDTVKATQDERVDVAIIGAGYTGLSAAIHLRQTGTNVVVIEAAEAGWGASGRNGGYVIPGLKMDPDEVEQLMGSDRGRRLVAWSAAAPDMVFDLIDQYKIDCNPVRNGWFQPAYTNANLEIVTSRCRQWQERGAPVEMLDPHELPEMLGTPKYVGGWLDRRGGTINPMAYSRGLARVALAAGVRIYTSTPAQTLDRTGSVWTVTTPNATITADHVIVATGAYCGDLVPGLPRTIIATRIGEVASKPLSHNILAKILPGRQGASDSRRLLASFRITPDGRLMMGGSTATAGPETHKIRDSLRRAARDLFGHYGELEWDFFWSGVFAVTPDKLPHLYEPSPNFIAALGCNGRGIAVSTAMGKVLAERVRGAREEDLVLPVSRLAPMHFLFLRRPVMQVLVGIKGIQDKIDRART